MLSFYNTFTRKRENFVSLKEKQVTLYNCGPTVYGPAHIGNLSAYLMSDLLRRVLELKGYKVHQVMNITDVGHLQSDGDTGEDKLDSAAKARQQDPLDLAKSYEEQFHLDRKELSILDAHSYPRASDYVSQQIRAVKKLLQQGQAYELEDGIYFSVETYSEYGCLSHNKLEDLHLGARVALRTDKKHPADFALWKKCVGENSHHILRWSFETGERIQGGGEDSSAGFPGWHIECSVMAQELLGEVIDIHTGGEDNIFPHHEAEIAQSCSLSGKPIFARYWIHKRHVFVEGSKMSKSKGNFYTLSDLKNKGIHPLAYRYLILSIHYRQNTNFTWKGLEDSQKAINKLQAFLREVQQASQDAPYIEIKNYRENFLACLDDDLNTSGALASVFEMVKAVNIHLNNYGGIGNKDDVLSFLTVFDDIFAILNWTTALENTSKIEEKIEARNQARANKDFALADKIRDKLLAEGIEIKDGSNGTVWRKIHM